MDKIKFRSTFIYLNKYIVSLVVKTGCEHFHLMCNLTLKIGHSLSHLYLKANQEESNL